MALLFSDTIITTWFPVLSFCLLGIERLLYGYIYHFPLHFKKSCKTGKFGAGIQLQIPQGYWKCMMTMGAYIKVFQFSVILYDLSIRNQGSFVVSILQGSNGSDGSDGNNNMMKSMMESIMNSYPQVALGLFLIGMGQVLNLSVFRALGGIGVYYGHELGYEVPFVHCFPYNTGISDPQYWGVVLCVWGIYVLCCGIPIIPTSTSTIIASSSTTGASAISIMTTMMTSCWIVPLQELFWYVMSMKLIEHNNGKRLLLSMGIKKDNK